jgi:hypothetical protein
MQIKVYVPTTVEIPSEYMVPLAQRARDALGDAANTTSATRGHLVRQAIRDGLLRHLDNLIEDSGSVDVVCDPHDEIPLELENRIVTLNELLATMVNKRSVPDSTLVEMGPSTKTVPLRKAA